MRASDTVKVGCARWEGLSPPVRVDHDRLKRERFGVGSGGRGLVPIVSRLFGRPAGTREAQRMLRSDCLTNQGESKSIFERRKIVLKVSFHG